MEMDESQFEENCKKVVDFVIGQGFEIYRNENKRSVLSTPIMYLIVSPFEKIITKSFRDKHEL